MKYCAWYGGEPVSWFDELTAALPASRALAAQHGEPVDVRDEAGVILAVSFPADRQDAGPAMRRARIHNFNTRGGVVPDKAPSLGTCAETGRPHVWWLHEASPRWNFRCQDCMAYGYQGRGATGDVVTHRCATCGRAATNWAAGHRGRRRWYCGVHCVQR